MTQANEISRALPEKPGLITALAILTLVSGIVNLLWSVIVALFLAATFLGLLCLPLAGYTLALGILEIVYAAKLLGTPRIGLKPAKYLSAMEIANIVFANPLSLVVGILSLVFYSDPDVKAFFQQLEPS